MNRSTSRTALALAAFSAFIAVIACGAPPRAEFTVDAEMETKDGYAALEWSAGEGEYEYQLQSALTPSFESPVTRYEGRDKASFISGLEDGVHYFRVRAKQPDAQTWREWSEPATVSVKHHSMTLTWILFGAGAVVFAATAAFVIFHAIPASRAEVDHG